MNEEFLSKFKKVIDHAAMRESARDVALKIDREVGPALKRIDLKAQIVMSKERLSRHDRYLSLQALVDEAIGLVSSYTPCKKGCNYCCYTAVPISQYEATRIAKFSGRELNYVGYKPTDKDPMDAIRRMEENTEKYLNTPCPFIGVEGECTVYSVRPMPCRTMHVAEKDSEFCDCFSGKVGVNMLDLRIEGLSSELFWHTPTADIREWFPEGSK